MLVVSFLFPFCPHVKKFAPRFNAEVALKRTVEVSINSQTICEYPSAVNKIPFTHVPFLMTLSPFRTTSAVAVESSVLCTALLMIFTFYEPRGTNYTSRRFLLSRSCNRSFSTGAVKVFTKWTTRPLLLPDVYLHTVGEPMTTYGRPPRMNFRERFVTLSARRMFVM